MSLKQASAEGDTSPHLLSGIKLIYTRVSLIYELYLLLRRLRILSTVLVIL